VHAAGSMAGQWPSTMACNENRLVFDARVDITKQITAATNPITEQKAALCPELESQNACMSTQNTKTCSTSQTRQHAARAHNSTRVHIISEILWYKMFL